MDAFSLEELRKRVGACATVGCNIPGTHVVFPEVACTKCKSFEVACLIEYTAKTLSLICRGCGTQQVAFYLAEHAPILGDRLRVCAEVYGLPLFSANDQLAKVIGTGDFVAEAAALRALADAAEEAAKAAGRKAAAR